MQTLTNKNILMTLVAQPHGVVHRKIIPMALLVFGQYSGTVAEGTHAPQCPEDGRADKLRPVWDVLDGMVKFVIHFEGNDALFFIHIIYLSLKGNPINPSGDPEVIII